MVTLVDNVPLRNAVAAFSAKSEQATYLEVLRNLQQGDVLFDITGSELRMTDDGSSIAAGSKFAIRGGKGPDGERALFVFTRQEEVARLHPEGTTTETLGQPAATVLEYAARQGDGWLYIDPAGPTCAIRIAEADFILRNPRNDAVKAALARGRGDVVEALTKGGQLFYAITEHPDGRTEVRTSTAPDGAPVRLAYTSPVEVVVSAPGAAWAAIDVARIVDDAITAPFAGLVLNPAGPWIGLFPDELAGVRARLADTTPPPEATGD